MISKEDLQQKYHDCKRTSGKIPKYSEFLAYAGIGKRKLTELYGREAYAQLQLVCGDDPNKLVLDRTPTEVIMRQYGDLALQIRRLPNTSDWLHHGLRPSVEGLRKRPHHIAWAEMPQKFATWTSDNRVSGYEKVLAWINQLRPSAITRVASLPKGLEALLSEIRSWSPAIRRSAEESYKVELRSYLRHVHKHSVQEERGDSSADVVVDRQFVVETKKDPNMADYDRLFGQLARHLQHYPFAIALIFDVPRDDAFREFQALVDLHFNSTTTTVEIIKK